MTLPAVSVLLPARNAATTLTRALGSVLRARGVALEVVALDHASTDGTGVILQRAAAKDARVRVVHLPDGGDLGAVLERGRALCRAPFVARMDADDIMHPARLAEDVAVLRAHRNTAACASQVKVIPVRRGTEAQAFGRYVAWQNTILSADDHRRDAYIEQPLCHPATTLRAAAVAAVGGYRSGPFAEDYDLFLRLLDAGFDLEKRPVVRHGWRVHEQMATRTDPRYARDAHAGLKAESLVRRYGVDTRPVLILGAGKEGRRIARALQARAATVAAFVDVNPRVIGRVRRGAVVHAASALPGLRRAMPDAFAVGAVGTSGAREVVREALAQAGFSEGLNAAVVA